MRIVLVILFILSVASLKAQAFLPGSFMHPNRNGALAVQSPFTDSLQKKWFVTRQSALSASYSFFKGGSASIVAAPFGLQLNRRLNQNLYAFVNATVAPAYVSFNRAFITRNFDKGGMHHSLGSGNLHLYSSASMGLLYINKEKNFSLSGSISVERSSYPLLPYYGTNLPHQHAVPQSHR